MQKKTDMNYNPDLKNTAQKLRNSMTPQESKLWYQCLRKLSIQVKRQRTFGNYIVDFYCSKAKLVIEIDGSQHYEGEIKEADAIRNEEFAKLGIVVVRYSNRDVDRNFRGVCEHIMYVIEQRTGEAVRFLG